MKRFKLVCLLVLMLAPISVCSAQTEGKWLDYGDGMVNLTQVKHVSSFSSYEGCSVKFDGFMLPLCPTNYNAAEEVRTKLAKDNKKVLQDTLKGIADFIKSSDNYKQL